MSRCVFLLIALLLGCKTANEKRRERIQSLEDGIAGSYSYMQDPKRFYSDEYMSSQEATEKADAIHDAHREIARLRAEIKASER